MIKSFTLIIISTCLIFLSVFSQNCPANIDFESGNFNNWQCFIGNTYVSPSGQNVIDLLPSPPTPGRHELISSATTPGMDFYGNFPKLCPYGGKYSVKLGNELTGAEAEGYLILFKFL